MPSARMGQEGEVSFGYGYVPPYILYNARFQLTDFLEISGNYRIFKGIADPILTCHGFGDFSDKGANLKISLFNAEISRYELPGVAIGLEDFIGTKAFHAYYLVLTQVFLKQNLEISFGYGANRIRKWFGGMVWMPFRHSPWSYLDPLSIVFEYDAIPYKDETIERHPEGRAKYTPWQFGLKYRLWDSIDLSAAYIRGDRFACTISTFYNFGTSKGLLPKIHDVLPYRAPVNVEPIGKMRPPDAVVQEFIFTFREQGFDVSEVWLTDEGDRTTLRLRITNLVYREEKNMRDRINAIVSSLVPDNVDDIIVTIDALTIPIQELRYEAAYLRLYRFDDIGKYELQILTPWKEASSPGVYNSALLFKKQLEWCNLELLPKTNTLFGSASGKFKCALGLSLNINGFLQNTIYYSISLGYYFFSYLKKVHDVDQLNPSQIINVRSDITNYYKQRGVTVDEAYLETVQNWGKGFYSRLAIGLFEREYGGVANEWLYFPVQSSWAIGVDFALLKKRTPHGVDFTSKIRQLHGFTPHYKKFVGFQYFLNLYYDWKDTGLNCKMSIGKFLANDVGVRTELARYFPSGLQLGIWYTYTNAHDVINNEVYHDKGIFFSVPLDIFYTKTSRSRWGYGMSAWLRDVGVTAATGGNLYELINQERQ